MGPMKEAIFMSPRSQNADDGYIQFSFKTSAVGDFNKIRIGS